MGGSKPILCKNGPQEIHGTRLRWLIVGGQGSRALKGPRGVRGRSPRGGPGAHPGTLRRGPRAPGPGGPSKNAFFSENGHNSIDLPTIRADIR